MNERLASRDLLLDGFPHACHDLCGNDGIIPLNGVPTPVWVTERGPSFTAVEFAAFGDSQRETIEQALAFVLSRHSAR